MQKKDSPREVQAEAGVIEPPAVGEITGLLREWNAGNEQAFERVTELVYRDLRRAAHKYMQGERPLHTLQTTALVHEVYLRLFGVQRVNWQNRVHFLAVCARLMRRVLIDFARQRRYQKRGGDVVHLSLDETLTISPRPDPDLVRLDEALKTMAKVDPRKAEVVELRFFGGLTVEETAEALGVSPETVMRDWRLAKPWLLREISRGNRDGS
jgi:RNA polymerase sigma-70 factor (ECF subfamily)